MAIYGVYDYDYFHYENVVPNLECAKLITYYRTHNHIAVMVPEFNPAPYTQFFVRKDYDDGIYPKDLFSSNCVYGGRAFTPNKYSPLDPKIERTVPDMHIYDKYAEFFGGTKEKMKALKRIVNCAHMRLAPDSKNMYSFNELQKYFDKKTTGIFLHDYDLASLDCIDLIRKLQDQRKYATKDEIRPYPVGNKFPIKIYDSNELQKWLKIITIPNCFFLEYYGLMTDEVLNNLCVQNQKMAKQIFYNVTYGCSSENDFFINRIRKIFIQSLFLRKTSARTLLTYDKDFFKTKELENFIELLNCYIDSKWFSNFLPASQALYQFCRYNKKMQYISEMYQLKDLLIDEVRDIFQYIRERDYELFKLFYEWDSVIYKGGRFVSEWDPD